MKVTGLTIAICYLALCNGAVFVDRGGNRFPTSKNFYSSQQSPKTQYVGQGENDARVLRNELEMKTDGSYYYGYETSNGISAMESGTGGVAVQGSSSWISPEGIEIKTTYVADETGYHPVGDHIPKIPDYILRSLEYIRTHPYPIQKFKSTNTATRKPTTNNRLSSATFRPTLSRKLTPPPVRPTNRRLGTRNQYQGSGQSKFFKF